MLSPRNRTGGEIAGLARVEPTFGSGEKYYIIPPINIVIRPSVQRPDRLAQF
jgi:hypothetical protein